MKDNFSAHASSYAQFRPVYPLPLYDYLLTLVKEKKTAWDCGTGNGQVAGVLANHFDKVIGTDISSKQLELAVQKPNIEYRILPAEKTDIGDGSINLITVAQAIHWFGFEDFYTEVNRVAAQDSIIAIWCYNLLEITEKVDPVIRELYSEILGDQFWDPERKYIEEHYQTIPFPFEEIQSPDFKIEVSWNVEQLIGYLNSWSAVQHFIKKNASNPVNQVAEQLREAWSGQEFRKVSFPIFTRIGRINA
jgi:hypothetical protein